MANATQQMGFTASRPICSQTGLKRSHRPIYSNDWRPLPEDVFYQNFQRSLKAAAWMPEDFVIFGFASALRIQGSTTARGIVHIPMTPPGPDLPRRHVEAFKVIYDLILITHHDITSVNNLS